MITGMKRRLTEYRFNGLIALLLFGVFAVCVLGVLLTGADAYRRLTERDKDAYNRRTYVQYMATRVRQAAGAGSVSVEDFGGEDALVLLDGKGWATRVYFYDGYIMELYTEDDFPLGPEAGQRVMEAGGLEMSLKDGLLSVTCIDIGGKRSSLLLSLRGRSSDEE